MPIELKLSAHNNTNALYNNLTQELQIRGINARAQMDDENNGIIYLYADNTVYEDVKNAVAEAASRFIIDNYEQNEIDKIIKSCYQFFTPLERRELLNGVKNALIGDKSGELSNSLFLMRRKNIITRRVIEYLSNKDTLLIDGFLPFRLKDYLDELEEFVDKSADDYMIEKEYKEFLNLLKYFVSMQDSKVDILNVIAFKTGHYALLDKQGNEVNHQSVDDFLHEVRTGDLSYDDLLISALITLAPGRIILHNQDAGKKELMDTLKYVFAGRIAICGGCSMCNYNDGMLQ